MNRFRWRSWLGASVVLFLLYGLSNVVAAILVPSTLVASGAGAPTGLVLSPDADAYLVGGRQVMAALRHDNPKLDTLLVSSMVAMCGQMMAFGILSIAVSWFVMRRAIAWGFWAVTAGALIQVPYYAVISSMYAGQGAPVAGGLVGLAPFYVWPLVALAVGLVGLRRQQAAPGLRGAFS